MSLSLSTFFIFIFLIPAMVFRQMVYSNSIVKRPIGAGNLIHIIVNALTISFIIQVISITLFIIFVIFTQKYLAYDYNISLDFSNDNFIVVYNDVLMSPEKFFINKPIFIIIYLFILLTMTLVIAKLFSALSHKNKFIGRMIYGPLATIMNETGPTWIFAFALTKIANGKDRVMYMGFLEELALKDGSDINHIVISDPVKFYFRMNKNKLKTTYDNAIPVSKNLYTNNVMYISGAEIENVHFDQYYGR